MVFPPNRFSALSVLSVALMGGVALLAAGCKPAPAPSSAPQAAPASKPAEFKAFLQDNNLAGKVAFIEFGQVGCELSDEGLTKMVGLHKSKRIEGLTFARVEGGKDSAAIEKYLAEKKPPFPVVRDRDGALARATGATAIPSFILVDKFARIRYCGSFPDERLLTEWCDSLGAEKSAGESPVMFGVKILDGPKLLAQTKLPDFIAGGTMPLKEYLLQNGMILVFVDTTCPYAVTALGEMPQISAVLEKRDIRTVVINIENTADEVAKFYQEHYTGATVVFDTTTKTRLAWGIQSVPTVVYIDNAGNVVYNGKAVWKDLAAAIETALKLPANTIQFKPAGTGYG